MIAMTARFALEYQVCSHDTHSSTKRCLERNARFAIQNRGIFQTISGSRLCHHWQTPLSG